MRLGVMLAVLVFSLAFPVRPAAAQMATSLEQLQVLVRPGDSIVVTDSAGAITSGRISELTPSLLRVQSGSLVRDFSEADVVRITQRRGDSLANGALIGAFSGLGFGAAGAILICTVESCGAWAIGTVGVYTALGAGIGVGIDALIVRPVPIFQSRTTAAPTTFRLVPLLLGARKGVSISVAF